MKPTNDLIEKTNSKIKVLTNSTTDNVSFHFLD